MAELEGRAALVTGAASGIGRAITERLQADGADVLAVDLTPPDDGPGTPFEADLTTREGNKGAVDAAVERFGGRLDAIVANAGFQHVESIAEFPEDTWDGLVSLLLTSPFLLAKYGWQALALALGVALGPIAISTLVQLGGGYTAPLIMVIGACAMALVVGFFLTDSRLRHDRPGLLRGV